MRLLLLENGLTTRVNHHTTSAFGHQAEAKRRGIDCIVYANRHASAETVAALGARATFPDSPYDRASRDPLCGTLEDALFFGRRFADACRIIDNDGVSADDILLVPTARPASMLGLGRWLATVAPERKPRLVLNLHNDDFLNRVSRQPNENALVYRYAARRMCASIPAERLLMTATNAKLATLASKILPVPVLAFPAPQFYDDDTAEDAAAQGDGRIRVSVLGGLRIDKGALKLADILRQSTSLEPNLSFFVQTSPGFVSAVWARVRRELASLHASVDLETSEQSLSASDYPRRLHHSDIVLCPYDPSYFVARISGVFSDAVAHGRPCVVPDGSWMADQLREGRAAGVTFVEFTADSIAAALARAAGQLTSLRQHAAALAPTWRREQCIGAYIDRMLTELAARRQ